MGNSNGSSASSPSTAAAVSDLLTNPAIMLQEDEVPGSAASAKKQLLPGVFGVTSTSSPSQQLRFTNHMSTLQKQQQSSGNKAKTKAKDSLLNSSFDFNASVQQQRPQQSTFLTRDV